MKNRTKHALVSGGTAGIGLSIVKSLVKQNYKVTFIGRNLETGHDIESELNTNSNQIHTFVSLDLSDLKKVKAFTTQFSNVNQSLDLLVNVAGIMSPKQQITPAGLDKTFATGYLSAFILSTELIPLLENGNPSRIVNVGGQASHLLKQSLDFNNLDFKTKYSGFKTAITTVHAKTVLTQILAEQLIDKNIDVNSFHPGFVQSDLSRNMPKILQFFAKLVKPLLAKRSKNGIFVCTDQSITSVSGMLFTNEKPTPLSFDLDYREKLWASTENILSKYSKT